MVLSIHVHVYGSKYMYIHVHGWFYLLLTYTTTTTTTTTITKQLLVVVLYSFSPFFPPTFLLFPFPHPSFFPTYPPLQASDPSDTTTTTTALLLVVLYCTLSLSLLLLPSLSTSFFPCLSFASDPSDTVQVRTDKHMAPSLIYRLHQTRQ